MIHPDIPDPPVTLDELLGRCMGEIQFAWNILNSFLETCEDQLNDIRHEIECGQPVELGRRIHRLKGTAATVAARPLHQSLELLERMVRDGGDGEERMLGQLDVAMGEFRRVAEYVKNEAF